MTSMATATFAVNAFRFYADDGGEAASTPLAAQNTNVTVNVSTGGSVIVHLRWRVDEVGGAAGTYSHSLSYTKNGGGGLWGVSGLAEGGSAAQLTDGAATTNRATNGISDPATGTFSAGVQEETGSTVGSSVWPGAGVSVGAGGFTETVWAIKLDGSILADADVLVFSVTGTNNVSPQITVNLVAPVALNQSSESGTAQAIGKAKLKAIGQATSSETAQALTANKSRSVALNQASETNTAQPFGKAKAKALAQASEVGTSQLLGRQKIKPLRQVNDVQLSIAGPAPQSALLNSTFSQSFGECVTVPVGCVLLGLTFELGKESGATLGTLTAAVYATTGTPGSTAVPTGSAIATSTNSFSISGLSGTLQSKTFTFDGTLVLQRDVTYWLGVQGASLGSSGATLGTDNADPDPASNSARKSGSTWTAFSTLDVVYSANVRVQTEEALPFTVVQSGGGTVVALNQSSESGTAQAIGKLKLKAFGQAAETDTAQAFVASQIVGFAQASETSTAQPFAKSKVKALAQATEANTAQLLGRVKVKAFAQASETGTAQAIGKLKLKAFAQASETDVAQAFTEKKTKALAQASETDTAQAITSLGNKIIALAQAIETSTAQLLGRIKVKAFGQAAEAATTQAFTEKKTKALAQAAESSTAQVLAERKLKAFGQAAESSTALAFTHTGVITVALNQAVEVSSVSGFTIIVTSVQQPSSGGGTAQQRVKWRRAAEHVLLGSGHGRLNARPEFLTFSAGADYTIKGHSLHASAKALVRLEAEAIAFLTAVKPLRVSSTRRLVGQAGGTQVLRSKPLRSQAGKLGRLRGLQRRARLSGQVEEGVVELKTSPNRAIAGRPKVVGVQNPSERELALMAIDFVKSRRKNR